MGGQSLPTDPDAIDYLNRVATADGAAVEVGVAQAIDAFVKGCKADSAGYAGDPTRTNWDALQACCIMAGARTISGALVPLKGTAPTAQGGWTSSEYSRGGSTPGLKGNGSTLYLDSNFNDASVGRDDIHEAVYVSAFPALSNTRYAGTAVSASGTQLQHFSNKHFVYNRSSGAYTDTGTRSLGFLATNRQESETYSIRQGGVTTNAALASAAVGGQSVFVFAYNSSGAANHSDARLSFYSLGSACDLAALDARVSTLMAAIQAFLP